ncbi:periplasmic binding protein-like I [Chlamydoabsidia padenii]|nr:periplasmic binding protein-like I [Chlamydoabsidia padenii]
MKKRGSLFTFLLCLIYIIYHQPTFAAEPTSSDLMEHVPSATVLSSNATSTNPALSDAGALEKPTYNIGVLFPDASTVRSYDPVLNNMILTSTLAVQLAAKHIQEKNYLPDVNLNFTRYYSSASHDGETSWTTIRMIEDGVNAVIGDMISNTTQISAGLTGLFQIPQCSCGAVSLDLSDKAIYPYFFRTMVNIEVFGDALMEWLRQMNWSMFSLVYTDKQVGQQVLASILNKSNEYGITPMQEIPLYDLSEDSILDSLYMLTAVGSRIVIVAESDPGIQVRILMAARTMEMLGEGWVWMLMNDPWEVQSEDEDAYDMSEFDGLMFITGLWNLTDVSAYNELYNSWQQQPAVEGFVDPSKWNTTGLSYNGPNAWACAEVLALGLNKALNEYPGGRQRGLLDLSNHTFNSTPMTPTFYNMNYTGPSGLMVFTDSGDKKTGHFELKYMMNGSSVAFAQIHDNVYEPIAGVPILYLGSTYERPPDTVARISLNPKTSAAAGLGIYTVACIGIGLCGMTMVLIVCYRDLKMVLVSSPIFLHLQLLGITSAYVSVLLYIDDVTAAKCIARQITLVLGFILVIGSIIAKNYRVYRVFQNVFTLQASKLNSVHLLRIVGVFGFVALTPLVVWYALYPVEPTVWEVDMESYCMLCSYPTSNISVDWIHLNIAELICAIICFIYIVIASLLAWKTRKINPKWSESQQIGYVSYNIGLSAIVAVPTFFLVVDEYQITIYLKLALILFSSTFTFFTLFINKLVYIFKYMSTQRWSLFSKLYPHHKQHDTDDEGLASCSELTSANQFDTQSSSNSHNAMNLLDHTVKAHEGVLPVKKWAQFNFMSIWQLKHVVVIPSKQMFVLMTTEAHKAEYHHYVSCQTMPRNSAGRYIFYVWTDKELQIYFQVHDQKALERWTAWFNGEERPDDDTNEEQQNDSGNGTTRPRKNNNIPSISTLGGASPSHNQGTSTNGLGSHSSSSSNVIDAFISPRSSVYHHHNSRHIHSPLSTVTTADHTDTHSFHGNPLQHSNNSNPISTFGAFGASHVGQNSTNYSY